jgi:hypothetical protein
MMSPLPTGTRPPMQLPPHFVPLTSHVVCGKGKACYTHSGNQAFRKLVKINLARYTAATNRFEKGKVANEIAQVIRQNGGGFIKMDPNTGGWLDVGDAAAKEKVAQTMREMALKCDPEKEARKHEKRVKSRARRLAAKKEQAPGTISPSSSQSSTPTTRSDKVTFPDETLSSVPPPPPPLISHSSRDWFDDSDLSDTPSVAGPGEELDGTFFDNYAFPKPAPYAPPLMKSSQKVLPKEFTPTSATPSLFEQLAIGMFAAPPPTLKFQSSMEYVPTQGPPSLSFQTSIEISPIPTPSFLKFQTSRDICSAPAPPSLMYQSSREWFLQADKVNVEPIADLDEDDFFDSFACNDNQQADVPRYISI